MCVDGKLRIVDIRIVRLDDHAAGSRSYCRNILTEFDEGGRPISRLGSVGLHGDKRSDHDRDSHDQPSALPNHKPDLLKVKSFLFSFAVTIAVTIGQRIRIAGRPRVMRSYQRGFIAGLNLFEFDFVTLHRCSSKMWR